MIRSCSGRTSRAEVRQTSVATSRSRPAACASKVRSLLEPLVDGSWTEVREPVLRQASSRSRPGRLAAGEQPTEQAVVFRFAGRTRLSPSADLSLGGAARGRRGDDRRVRTGRIHVSSVPRSGESPWSGRGLCRASGTGPILGFPSARRSGDRERRRVAQLAEHRSPKPGVGGSSPSAPAREPHEPTDEASAGARREAAEALRWRPTDADPGGGAPCVRSEKRKRTGVRQFLREVRQELRKVDWPNRKELVTYTVVVLVTVTVLTAYVFGSRPGVRAGHLPPPPRPKGPSVIDEQNPTECRRGRRRPSTPP